MKTKAPAPAKSCRFCGQPMKPKQGKPERYIEKLKKLVPNVIIMGKGKGPVAGSIAVRVKSNGK